MSGKLVYIVAVLILAGCATEDRENLNRDNPKQVIESTRVDPETGNLIAWWMTRREGTPKGQRVAVLVPCSYAVYIEWPNEQWCPNSADKRIFVFYDNVAKKSYRTNDFDTFLNILAAQPRDIQLLQFDTCSGPRCWMPEQQWNRLEKVLAEGNRKWGINPVEGARTIRVCYCAFDGNFIFPGNSK